MHMAFGEKEEKYAVFFTQENYYCAVLIVVIFASCMVGWGKKTPAFIIFCKEHMNRNIILRPS